jgi:hypothetical protein
VKAFLTLASDESVSRPGHFTFEEEPLDRRLGGFQSKYGHYVEEKYLLPMPELNLDSFAIQSLVCCYMN